MDRRAFFQTLLAVVAYFFGFKALPAKAATDSINEFTRARIRHDAFLRRIMPPEPARIVTPRFRKDVPILTHWDMT
jgi:hypothetical protein